MASEVTIRYFLPTFPGRGAAPSARSRAFFGRAIAMHRRFGIVTNSACSTVSAAHHFMLGSARDMNFSVKQHRKFCPQLGA